MKKVIILSLILAFILIFGCININVDNPEPQENNSNLSNNNNTDWTNNTSDWTTDYDNTIEQPVAITVSGVGQYQEINETKDVRLVISGIDNEVFVHDGTNVIQLTMSGIRNTVSLPKDNTPQVVKSGVDTVITYRQS